jgi:hypothetical protein
MSKDIRRTGKMRHGVWFLVLFVIGKSEAAK